MSMMTRRALLSGAAPTVAAIGLAGCATFPAPTTGGGLNPAFIDAVVAALQSGCTVGVPFIPTATTIAGVVASLFGPAALASVQLIGGSINAVATAICAAVPKAAMEKARLRMRLARSSYALPVVIGVTPQGVTVTGYQR